MNPIDLRSDTVTRPTSAMRRAAGVAGKEAALFVPIGTKGNTITAYPAGVSDRKAYLERPK
jgi:threonine aldolase